MSSNAVKEGDFIVLDINGEKFPLVKVVAGGKVKVSKNFVSMDPLIGAKFGTTFSVTAESSPGLIMTDPQPVWDDQTSTSRNNAQLVDDGSAQQLTQEEILKLKAEGKDGKDIIEILKQSSVTFAAKTEFSQEKYIRKKQKKYMTKVIVRRPTARVLCETYLANDPRRIHGMRVDTLSQMLCLGNAGAHGRVLVLDYCSGIVAGAVAERMGGMGLLVMAHGDTHAPPHDIVHRFNFEKAHYDSLRTCSLKRLLAAPGSPDALAPVKTWREPEVKEGEDEGAAGPGPSSAAAHGRKRPRAHVDKEDKVSQRIGMLSDAELAALKAQGFTSLIVAWPSASYATLLPALMPLLAPSSAFVAYHPSSQPLIAAFDALFAARSVINLQMTESWMRVHQVLPMRTHPNMSMSGTGGFLLTGTRVDANYKAPVEAPTAAPAAAPAVVAADAVPAAGVATDVKADSTKAE